ncbi:hypothetical protein V6N13_089625 [Hibiscus sabdariffa]
MAAREGSQIVNLFVRNLPPALHWSGLWQIFGRHGDIIESYIARKVDRTSKRFGFVKFKNRIEAERAIERLNGFCLYGFRLSVTEARYNGRPPTWCKDSYRGPHSGNVAVKQGSRNTFVDKGFKKEDIPPTGNQDVCSLLNGVSLHGGKKFINRFLGHVEEESMWKLSRCLVGTMATVCGKTLIEDKLQNWGLGEIVVKSLGGRKFLIEIKDLELYELLEDLKWSYLKEIFSDIEPWSESFHLPERVTWIRLSGVPLHCWNHTTFSRISEVWGKLLLLGENANQTIDAAEITLLIETNQMKKIEEVIYLEVGKESFWIQVEELGFRNHAVIRKEQNEKGSPKGGASRKLEDEAIQFVCLGKNIKADGSLIECDDGRFVGESDILGENNIGTVPKGDSDSMGQDKVLDGLFEINGLNLDDSHLTKDPPRVDAGSTGLDSGECVGRTDKTIQPTSMAIEDILTMGFKNNELTQVVNRESESEEDISGDQIVATSKGNVTWDEGVDLANNNPTLEFAEDGDSDKTMNPTIEPLINNGTWSGRRGDSGNSFSRSCGAV